MMSKKNMQFDVDGKKIEPNQVNYVQYAKKILDNFPDGKLISSRNLYKLMNLNMNLSWFVNVLNEEIIFIFFPILLDFMHCLHYIYSRN